MWDLRQSTATVVHVGPFLDAVDGVTTEESLSVTAIDVRLHQPLDGTTLAPDLITNGAFATDTDWTKGSGWTIGSGTATGATASTDLEQTVSVTENKSYEVTYTISNVTAGSVTVKIGGTAGTARSTNGTFTETIVAGSGSLIEFTGSGFTGNIDDVTLKQVPKAITPAASGSVNDMAHTANGMYDLELSVADLAFAGIGTLGANVSGALPVWHEYRVLPANVYDAKYGSDKLQVDVSQWSGTNVATPSVAGVPEVDVTHMAGGVQTVTDLKDFADAGYDPATNKVQGVVLADTVTTLTGHTAQTGDSYARLGAPAGASVSADVAAVKTDTAAILVDTAEIGAAGAGLTALATAANLATVDTVVGGIQTDLDNGTDGLGAIKTAVDAIPTTPMRGTDGANTTTPPTAVAIADQVWDEARAGHVGVGSFGEEVQDTKTAVDAIPTTPMRGTDGAATATNLATVDTVVDAIKAVTDALPDAGALTTIGADTARLTAARAQALTDWIDAGRLDALLDAIKAKTDNLPVDPADQSLVIAATDAISTAIAALNDLSAADMRTALGTNGSDVIAELAQAIPSATPSLADAIMLLYMQLRNALTSTSSEMKITNDAGTTIAKAALSDDATTFTKAELAAGP